MLKVLACKNGGK